MSVFNNVLVTLRKSKGFFKSDDYADVIEIDRGHYADLESGKADPSIEDLLALSYATGKTIDYLVTGRDYPPSSQQVLAA